MELNGDRQRINDLERRMASVEAGIGAIQESVGNIRTDLAVGFARLETRQEVEERSGKHQTAYLQPDSPGGLGSLVSTPNRQAAAILGTLFAAILAAVLQLLGIEIGGG